MSINFSEQRSLNPLVVGEKKIKEKRFIKKTVKIWSEPRLVASGSRESQSPKESVKCVFM